MKKNYFLLMLIGFISQSTFAQTPVQVVDDFLNQAKQKGTIDSKLDYNVITEDVIGNNQADYVKIQQTINGIPVYGGNATFFVQDGKVINHNETFVYGNNNKSLNVAPSLTVEQAIQSMAQKLGKNFIATSTEDLVKQFKNNQPINTENSVSFLKESPSYLYYYNNDGNLRLAWLALTEIKDELQENNLNNLYETIIDANTGELLSKKSIIYACGGHDNTSENVYHNNPEDFKWVTNAFAAETTTLDAPLNGTYRVIPANQQSPLKSDFKLLTNVYDPVASLEGWHKALPEALKFNPSLTKYHTVGNNAQVGYDKNGVLTDYVFGSGALYIVAAHVMIGNEAYGGEKLLFDFPNPGKSMNYDPLQYTSAATTQMFYSVNSIHDILHYHGFTPKAGSFQMNVGDKARVLGFTTSGYGTKAPMKNNAFMAYSPTIMKNPTTAFLTFETLPADAGYLEIKDGPIKGIYKGASGNNTGYTYGKSPSVVADMMLINDKKGINEHDGCEAFPDDNQTIKGKIALVDRGGCTFDIKVKNIAPHNPAAIIFINNDPTSTLDGMVSVGQDELGLTIPIASIEKVVGDQIKAAIAKNETVSGTMPSSNFSFRTRDSGFDSQVILHEYTHAVSNRLTGGKINGEEGMGEGWSDYVALNLTQQAYQTSKDLINMGEYAFDGAGLRILPYTTDMKANPHTYDYLKVIGAGENKMHPTGYVWALMLWELHWKMIDKYGFNPDFKSNTGGNNMTLDLVLQGLKIQKNDPGFVDGRDGILMADVVLNKGTNQCLIWEAFAKRGLGYSANQGDPLLRTDGKEAFDLPPTCARLGTDELEVNDVTIYPNPVKDLVYINAKDNVNKYEIIDVTGRLIETGQVEKDNQVNRVSTNRLATGVYILKLYTNKGVVTKKIIKK